MESYDGHMRLAQYAAVLLQANGDPAKGSEYAAAAGRDSIARILRSAISVGSTSDSGWASSLTDHNQMIAAFVSSLAGISIFDALFATSVVVPMRTAVALVLVGVSGNGVSEGSPKPISQLSIAGDALEQRKAVAIAIITNELARLAGPRGIDLLNRELRTGVTAGTNRIFLDEVLPSSSAIPSTNSPLADIRALLAAVGTGAGSRLLLAASSGAAKELATAETADGARLFPDFSPTAGGELCSIPAIVSNELEDNTGGGSLALFDSAGFAMAGETIVLDVSTQSTVQVDSAPDNPVAASTAFRSLWHTNSQALKAERFFAFSKLRADASALVAGTNYGQATV